LQEAALRRQVSEDKEDNWGLYAVVAAVTFVAALGVSGGTNLWMMFTGNDLIVKYRPTLTFRSAWIGDGIILPVVNVLMAKSLWSWKPRTSPVSILVPVVGGSMVALLFHIAQGRGGLVNWTMPQPWHWNTLGYYHFIFMSTEFAFMLFYLTQLAGHWRKGEVTSEQKRDLGLIAVSMLAFAALLYTDYY
jgi:hypothetical protein